jgi:hypothetical protein
MMPACWWCGQPEVTELAEAWGHEFQIETCCEARHQEVVEGMNDDPAWGLALLRSMGAEELLGYPLRRVPADMDAGQILLDYELAVRPIAQHRAQAFVAQHHGHNGALAIDRYRAGCWNGPTLVGVVVVGNPTSPALMNTGQVEVRRLCTDRSLPATIRYKAATALYGWAVDTAERKGWRRIITYTLASETGLTLRYCKPRWKCEGPASREGASWEKRGPNRKKGPTEAKVLWSRALHPRVPRPIQMTFALPPQRRPKPRLAA